MPLSHRQGIVMAFTLPTFVIPVQICDGPWLTRTTRTLGILGNLAIGRRVQQSSNIDPFENLSFVQPTLLLPAGTDIRDQCCNGTEDVVEVPAGSGRWYQVIGVDDSGKGFPNEHRIAVLQKIYETVDPVAFPGLFWPTPIP